MRFDGEREVVMHIQGGGTSVSMKFSDVAESEDADAIAVAEAMIDGYRDPVRLLSDLDLAGDVEIYVQVEPKESGGQYSSAVIKFGRDGTPFVEAS